MGGGFAIKIRATSISTLEEAQPHSQSSPSSFLASQVEKSCPATCWVEESGPPSLTGPVCRLEESRPPSLSFPTSQVENFFFPLLLNISLWHKIFKHSLNELV